MNLNLRLKNLRYTKNERLYSPALNGEKWFLNQIISKAKEKVVVFEVGANVGTYSDLIIESAKQYSKDFELHLFEPQKICYNQLVNKYSAYSNITINNIGLSDKEGKREIFFDIEGSSAASFYKREVLNLSKSKTVYTTTLSKYIAEKKITYIDLLKVDAGGHEYNIIKGCCDFLDKWPITTGSRVNRFIKNIRFQYGGDTKDAEISLKDFYLLLKSENYYKIMRLYPSKLKHLRYHPKLEDYQYANFTAVSIKQLTPFTELFKKHNIKPGGVLHLGAHLGEEAAEYNELDIKNVLWVEGNPDIFPELKKNIANYNGHKAYNLLISDKDSMEVEFNITDNTQTSSILKTKRLKESYKDIDVINTKVLKTQTVDTLVREQLLDTKKYDLLSMDLQGAELLALKGMPDVLKSVRWVFTEFHLINLYENCAKLHQIDLFLGRKKFKRIETDFVDEGWGNALYERQKASSFNLISMVANAYRHELIYLLFFRKRKLEALMNKITEKMKIELRKIFN